MWIYEQSTGRLSSTETGFSAIGYSGSGAGKNNSTMQSVRDVGPIPCGIYAISAPFDSPEHGPYALRLWPDAANNMFGRSGFLMHGDSLEHPGCASQGCVIMPRDVRQKVWESFDRELRVVSGFLPTDVDLGT